MMTILDGTLQSFEMLMRKPIKKSKKYEKIKTNLYQCERNQFIKKENLDTRKKQ